EDFGPLLPVDGFGDGLGATDHGLDDEEVAGALGAEVEGGQKAGECGSVVPRFRRQRVVCAALRVMDLDEAQLADVAGEGRLRDIEAARLEELAKLFLASDPVSLDQLTDRCVPLRL